MRNWCALYRLYLSFFFLSRHYFCMFITFSMLFLNHPFFYLLIIIFYHCLFMFFIFFFLCFYYHATIFRSTCFCYCSHIWRTQLVVTGNFLRYDTFFQIFIMFRQLYYNLRHVKSDLIIMHYTLNYLMPSIVHADVVASLSSRTVK